MNVRFYIYAHCQCTLTSQICSTPFFQSSVLAEAALTPTVPPSSTKWPISLRADQLGHPRYAVTHDSMSQHVWPCPFNGIVCTLEQVRRNNPLSLKPRGKRGKTCLESPSIALSTSGHFTRAQADPTTIWESAQVRKQICSAGFAACKTPPLQGLKSQE